MMLDSAARLLEVNMKIPEMEDDYSEQHMLYKIFKERNRLQSLPDKIEI